MNTPDAAAPRPTRRRHGWGYEVFLVFPLMALLNQAASPLFSIWLSNTLPASLEFVDPAPIDLAGAQASLEGVTTIAVPVDDLSTWAVTQFAVAKSIWIAGLLVATWFASRAVSELVRGEQFSDRMSRSLAGLSWTLVVAGPVYALAQIPADNLITRDLGLTDAAIRHGLVLNVTFLWLGAVILVEILRRAVKRGRAVQDELDGLV